jgi:hypothetical protein
LTSFTPLFYRQLSGFRRKPCLSIFSLFASLFQKPRPEKQYIYLRECEYFIREKGKDYET